MTGQPRSGELAVKRPESPKRTRDGIAGQDKPPAAANGLRQCSVPRPSGLQRESRNPNMRPPEDHRRPALPSVFVRPFGASACGAGGRRS